MMCDEENFPLNLYLRSQLSFIEMKWHLNESRIIFRKIWSMERPFAYQIFTRAGEGGGWSPKMDLIIYRTFSVKINSLIVSQFVM